MKLLSRSLLLPELPNNRNESSWTPLKMISAFVGVIDTVIGATITQTSGDVQLVLTVFIVSFTILVAFGFFFMLWHKPEVLLTQPHFKSAAEGAEYIAALRGKVVQATELQARLVEKTNEIQAQMTVTMGELQALSLQTKESWAELEALQERVEEESKHLGDLSSSVEYLNYEARKARGDFY